MVERGDKSEFLAKVWEPTGEDTDTGASVCVWGGIISTPRPDVCREVVGGVYLYPIVIQYSG